MIMEINKGICGEKVYSAIKLVQLIGRIISRGKNCVTIWILIAFILVKKK